MGKPVTTIEQKLAEIRGRLNEGGPRMMQIGGDPNAKVWPAETWKICDSQADVAPMLGALEELYRDFWVKERAGNERQCAEAVGYLHILEKHLGGDDER